MRNNKNEFDRQILTDIQNMSAEELLEVHGISIDEESKAVYDQAYDKTFTNIDEWIYFSTGDEAGEFEKFGGHHGFADDY